MQRLVRMLVVVVALGAPAAASAQLKTPDDWKWRLDGPAEMAADGKTKPGEWWFVAMPPGWHLTMGPGGLVYRPDLSAAGRFALESELFLFPGTSQQELGLFLGGRDLESSPRWTAFVIRRDGSAAVLAHRGGTTTTLVEWARHEAIPPHPGGNETQKQLLRVEVERDLVRFLVNGAEVASVPAADVDTEGGFGFRIGRDVNLHVTTLDYTQRIAPPRRPKPQP